MHGEFVKNWIPIKFVTGDWPQMVQWLYIGNKKFTEPFFDGTMQHSRGLVENQHIFKSVSSLEMLPVWSADIPSIQPSAFIFHVSRCGSTLLSQLLALEPSYIVLSEVPFLDELLRLPVKQKLSIKESDFYFGEAIRFYAQKKEEQESHLFLKLDSWHLFFYERIRNLYPAVPFLILYREPSEIIESQHKARGMQSVPGLLEKDLFGFTDSDFTPDLDLYMSRVLEKYFSQILKIIEADSNCLLVNYNEGMLTIAERLLDRVAITPSPAFTNQMKERMAFDAKRPGFFFNQPDAPGPKQPFLEKSLALYQEIEKARLSMEASQNEFRQQVGR